MQQGRPRSYRFVPAPTFTDPGVALFDASLTEAAERLIDVVAPLSPGELGYTVGTSRLSVARIVRHIVWAEGQWIAKFAASPILESLAKRVADGELARFGSEPVGADAAELCAIVRELREGYSHPVLRSLALTAPIPGPPVVSGPRDLREVLMHLVWHWSYHSGQVGLVRELAGSEYTWRFEKHSG